MILGNYSGGATTVCPYYEKEAGMSITCTGAIENSLQMNRFKSKAAKKKWQECVCSSFGYKKCPIAKMLEEKFQKNEENVSSQKLKDNEQIIYDYIVSYIDDNLYPPSVREICKATNYSSTNAIYKILKDLHKLGLIQSDLKKSRAIKLIGFKIIKK